EEGLEGGAQLLVRGELRVARGRDRLDEPGALALDAGAEELVLGAVVEVQHGLGDLGLGRDRVHRGLVEALAREHFHGGVEHLLLTHRPGKPLRSARHPLSYRSRGVRSYSKVSSVAADPPPRLYQQVRSPLKAAIRRTEASTCAAGRRPAATACSSRSSTEDSASVVIHRALSAPATRLASTASSMLILAVMAAMPPRSSVKIGPSKGAAP